MDALKIQPISRPVKATIDMPGSKSYTNRALILVALSERPVTLKNALLSDDTEAMIDCLRGLGISIGVDGSEIVVRGSVKDVLPGDYDLNARLSGTTIRFLLPLLCVVPGAKSLKGQAGLNRRPIGGLVSALRQLGARIEYLKKEGYPPLRVLSGRLNPGTTRLKGDVSSQYFSALMMIAPVVGEVSVEVVGPQISRPYIDMTVDSMRQFGVTVANESYQRYTIPAGQRYALAEYTVEGDFSGAGYFFAIAALTGSTLTLRNLSPDSKQGDLEFVRILERMGNKIRRGKNEMEIIGCGVQPIEANMELCPDQAQTLAVLAAFAPGKTVLTGVRSLRIKETERVKALQTELAKMDIRTESPDEDTLIIHGGRPKPAAIETYGDHRMAMSFAVAGTKLEGMVIRHPEVVNKSFPGFWERLGQLGSKKTAVP